MHALVDSTTRELAGESITLHGVDGVTATVVSDAVVGINPPVGVSINTGKAEYTGVLRLAADHRAAALTSNTVTVRGNSWHVLSVGEVYADSFRVEIAREDQVHSNKFDINDQQALWQ